MAAIVNPHARHGRTRRAWPELQARIEQHAAVQAFFTEAPGHGAALTRQALRGGYSRIISVGGDGTHFEVCNGFFTEAGPVNPEAVMAVLPQGTGSDLARTLQIPLRPHDLQYLVGDKVIHADVGQVRCHSIDGTPLLTHFLNTCHIGVGGEVCYRVNRNSKAWGGFFTYLRGTLASLPRFRGAWMRVELDDEVVEGKLLEIIVANGQYDGGGMHLAPQAVLDDNLFEAYVIAQTSLPDLVRSLHLLYRGKLDRRPDLVRCRRIQRLSLQAEEPIRLGTDGECPGVTPAEIRLLPNALRLALP